VSEPRRTKPPASRVPLGRRLRDKLPELSLEVVSIVLAVLAALAVDEWRQARANAGLADTARASVLEEIRSNYGELADTREENQGLLDRINAALATEGRIVDLNLRFEIALLSTAAWETAQITAASRHMEFEWVAEVARVYRVQQLVDEAQGNWVDLMAGLAPESPEALRLQLRVLRQQLVVTLELADGLLRGYESLLDSEESASAVGS